MNVDLIFSCVMNRNPFGGIGLAMGFSGESLVTRSKDVFKFERKATAVVF